MQTEIEISDLQATIESLSKSKRPVDVARVKELKETLAAKKLLAKAHKQKAKSDEKNKSDEVKATESAHAKAKATMEAEYKERLADLARQKQANIDSKREGQERVNRKLDKEEAARQKSDKAVSDRMAKELETPLTADERIDMDRLERMANQGRGQPHATEMLKLGRYRVRAKIKG